MTTYTTPHSLPILEINDKIAAPGDGLWHDLNALSQATNTALVSTGARVDAVVSKNTTQDAAIASARTGAVSDAKTYTDAKAILDQARLAAVESKNTAQDGTLSNHASRVESLETLGGLAPGDVSDATVASLVANTGSDTAAELRGQYVGKAELFVSVTNAPYSADKTGVVDATAAIIAAEAAAVSSGRPLLMPSGTYRTSGTVTIRCAVEATEATLNYYGDGTALIVGDKSALSIITQRRTFRLPKVANKNRGTVAWVPTTIGVELVNLNACEVHVPMSRDSAIGVQYLGYGGGFAYNMIYLGSVNDNRVGVKLTQNETGWCNQNLTIGGRIEQNPVNGATPDDLGSTYIWLDSNSASISGANNNTFIGTSIENSVGGGGNAGYYRVINAGRYNVFYNCRWETGAGQTARILHKATSTSTEINGGYDSWKVVEVVEAGGNPGIIRDGTGGFYRQANTSAQVIPTGANTKLTGWPTSGLNRITYDDAGNFTPRAGTWRIRARVTFANNATGVRKAFLNCGGSLQDVAEAPAAATATPMLLTATYKFNGTQTLDVQVFQNSGADLALSPTSQYVKLEAEYLGY